MATIYQCLDSINEFITAQLNAASIGMPTQVYIGNPSYEELTKVLQRINQAQVAAWPMDIARSTTRFPAAWGTTAPVAMTLTAVVSGGTITFGGTPAAGTNIHVEISATRIGTHDAFVQVGSSDSLNTIAGKVRDAINALSLPGVTATALSNVVTVTGATSIVCNLGGSTTAGRIVRQQERVFQIRVVAPNGDIRQTIGEIILANVGTDVDPGRFFALPDGTNVWVKYKNDRWMDDMAMDTFYEWRIWFTADFPTVQTQKMYQVGTTQTSITGSPI